VDNGITLVTGASGSIGRATVQALAARGCSVVTIDKRPMPEPEATLARKHLKVDLDARR
jgi:NAD(P)-dependent dehydrogenase (short-subunit alcohol dehydrogenase family)